MEDFKSIAENARNKLTPQGGHYKKITIQKAEKWLEKSKSIATFLNIDD